MSHAKHPIQGSAFKQFVFGRIMEGLPVEDHDKKVVEELINDGALSYDNNNNLIPAVLAGDQWAKYTASFSTVSTFDVEILGKTIGVSNDWDMCDATSMVFYDFIPNEQFQRTFSINSNELWVNPYTGWAAYKNENGELEEIPDFFSKILDFS